MASWRVMRLINPATGEMECKVCGYIKFANLASEGKFRHGSWICPNGCTKEHAPKMHRFGGRWIVCCWDTTRNLWQEHGPFDYWKARAFLR
jgi:hypothetical protein